MGFPDRSLDTESSSVRAKIAGHANDLILLDVDGLRVDAAKRKYGTGSIMFSQHFSASESLNRRSPRFNAGISKYALQESIHYARGS